MKKREKKSKKERVTENEIVEHKREKMKRLEFSEMEVGD